VRCSRPRAGAVDEGAAAGSWGEGREGRRALGAALSRSRSLAGWCEGERVARPVPGRAATVTRPANEDAGSNGVSILKRQGRPVLSTDAGRCDAKQTTAAVPALSSPDAPAR
jgi:hypothetical protein